MEKLKQNKEFLVNLINYTKLINPTEPKQSIKAIISISEEVPFKFSQDEWSGIYRNLIQDFPVLENFYFKKNQGLKDSLTHEEKENLKGLFKWLIQKLYIWDNLGDQDIKILALIFIISNVLIENLWELIPFNIINNPKINTFLKEHFNKFECKIQIPSYKQVPIWEKEASQKYIKAIQDKDWQYLANNWHIWGNSPKLGSANVFQHQIFLFLLTYDQDKLISATEQYEDFISLMLICREHRFSLLERFQLALNTSNDLFRFVLLFSLKLNNNQYYELTDKEAEIFAKIFQKVAKDSNQLENWLIIFNYPVRFPIFAEGFGVYLAKYASEIETDSYLNSLELEATNLKNSDHGTRKILNKTFTKFAEIAEHNTRKELWKKCYEKYLDWNFGQKKEYYFLNEVHLSNIDYALVGYFLECEKQKNEEVILNLLNEIDEIFTKNWYGSKSEITTKFYNFLSKIQPVYCVMKADKDQLKTWLTEPNFFYSFDSFNNDRRYELTFNIKN